MYHRTWFPFLLLKYSLFFVFMCMSILPALFMADKAESIGGSGDGAGEMVQWLKAPVVLEKDLGLGAGEMA